MITKCELKILQQHKTIHVFGMNICCDRKLSSLCNDLQINELVHVEAVKVLSLINDEWNQYKTPIDIPNDLTYQDIVNQCILKFQNVETLCFGYKQDMVNTDIIEVLPFVKNSNISKILYLNVTDLVSIYKHYVTLDTSFLSNFDHLELLEIKTNLTDEDLSVLMNNTNTLTSILNSLKNKSITIHSFLKLRKKELITVDPSQISCFVNLIKQNNIKLKLVFGGGSYVSGYFDKYFIDIIPGADEMKFDLSCNDNVLAFLEELSSDVSLNHITTFEFKMTEFIPHPVIDKFIKNVFNEVKQLKKCSILLENYSFKRLKRFYSTNPYIVANNFPSSIEMLKTNEEILFKEILVDKTVFTNLKVLDLYSFKHILTTVKNDPSFKLFTALRYLRYNCRQKYMLEYPESLEALIIHCPKKDCICTQRIEDLPYQKTFCNKNLGEQINEHYLNDANEEYFEINRD
uniref:F-box domain-containing protein n=1 Tax=Rhabditophanes sp. KR3021 TaxID=114890 RepID=A0AC35TNH2_9BILA